MKFTAKKLVGGKNDGKWAVSHGNKYFINTVTDDELKAKITACERSASWHDGKMMEIREEWEKLMIEADPSTESDIDSGDAWHNLFC